MRSTGSRRCVPAIQPNKGEVVLCAEVFQQVERAGKVGDDDGALAVVLCKHAQHRSDGRELACGGRSDNGVIS